MQSLRDLENAICIARKASRLLNLVPPMSFQFCNKNMCRTVWNKPSYHCKCHCCWQCMKHHKFHLVPFKRHWQTSWFQNCKWNWNIDRCTLMLNVHVFAFQVVQLLCPSRSDEITLNSMHPTASSASNVSVIVEQKFMHSFVKHGGRGCYRLLSYHFVMTTTAGRQFARKSSCSET